MLGILGWLLNDGLRVTAICWDCTSVYFNIQWSSKLRIIKPSLIHLNPSKSTWGPIEVSISYAWSQFRKSYIVEVMLSSPLIFCRHIGNPIHKKHNIITYETGHLFNSLMKKRYVCPSFVIFFGSYLRWRQKFNEKYVDLFDALGCLVF